MKILVVYDSFFGDTEQIAQAIGEPFGSREDVEVLRPRILRLPARLFDYAAKPISDKLRKKGGELAAPPEGFFVAGTEGPLNQGELKRARDWAVRVIGAWNEKT